MTHAPNHDARTATGRRAAVRVLAELPRRAPAPDLRSGGPVTAHPARRASSLALALRAATSLVRMERGLSTPPASHQMLEEILVRFTEGADTPDLQSARQTLDAATPGS